MEGNAKNDVEKIGSKKRGQPPNSIASMKPNKIWKSKLANLFKSIDFVMTYEPRTIF